MTTPSFRWDVQADPDAVAARAAAVLANAVTAAVDQRGTALLALSGGSTPRVALERLAALPDVPWRYVHVAQVDERLAPDGHEDRNLTMLRAALLDHVEVASVLPMPVVAAETAAAAAAQNYGASLETVAGRPVRIDVLQLGLGADGHTASLVPGDPILDVDDRDVALTATYSGRRRMTLTAPCLQRARQTVWIAHGEAKRPALQALVEPTSGIPARLAVGVDNIVITDVDIMSATEST